MMAVCMEHYGRVWLAIPCLARAIIHAQPRRHQCKRFSRSVARDNLFLGIVASKVWQWLEVLSSSAIFTACFTILGVLEGPKD
jgi:hypothetical protein